MTECKPIIKSNEVVCEVCHLSFTPQKVTVADFKKWGPRKIHRDCSAVGAIPTKPKPPKKPNIVKRAFRLVKETVKHIKNGRPKTTEAQREERLRICEACPSGLWIKDKRKVHGGTCAGCGCVGRRDNNFLNLFNWADKTCPRAHWPFLKWKKDDSSTQP